MIVGLPGAGISAFFYLALVLLMPFKLAWHAVRHSGVRRDHVRLITRQLAIGLGILASFSLIGLVLAVVLPEPAPVIEAGSGGTPAAVAVERGIARVGIFLGIGTLVGVLLVTRLLALTLSPRRAIPRPLRRRRLRRQSPAPTVSESRLPRGNAALAP